jgi:DNA-binding NtrC family response regulator
VQEFSAEHDRPFHGIDAGAMEALTDYPWPGNVRELRNLIESMVVLAHGREITLEDIPQTIREGASGGAARLLPVRIGPALREGAQAEGRELEFIVRSLLELKLQVEELRRRVDSQQTQARLGGDGESFTPRSAFLGSVAPQGALSPPSASSPPNVVSITPGMTMAEIEKRVIEATLRETRGNRRKAADLLAIGERTLYRKLKEYELGEVRENA